MLVQHKCNTFPLLFYSSPHQTLSLLELINAQLLEGMYVQTHICVYTHVYIIIIIMIVIIIIVIIVIVIPQTYNSLFLSNTQPTQTQLTTVLPFQASLELILHPATNF